MNWGKAIGWVGVVQSIAASIGYAFARDWRRSMYYFFAACISTTVVWGQDVHITPPAVTTPATVTVLERVIPRGCMLTVQLKTPDKCKVEGIEFTPDSECRGPVGETPQCRNFGVKLSPGCEFIVTKRADCENINVKKVPAPTIQQSSSAPREKPSTTSE